MRWEGLCVWKHLNPVLLLNKVFYITTLPEYKEKLFAQGVCGLVVLDDIQKLSDVLQRLLPASAIL